MGLLQLGVSARLNDDIVILGSGILRKWRLMLRRGLDLGSDVFERL